MSGVETFRRSEDTPLDGLAPVRMHPSHLHICKRKWHFRLHRTNSNAFLVMNSLMLFLQVVTARLRVVIEATASIRCSDETKTEEFTA
jgi:hypothetical protein